MRSTRRAAVGSAAVLGVAAVLSFALPGGQAVSDARSASASVPASSAAGEESAARGHGVDGHASSRASAPPARPMAIDTPAAPIRALAPYERAKAEALLRRRLPCLGCHRLDDEGGRIGPDLTSVGTRRTPAYIRAMIREPRATVPGTAMQIGRAHV